MYEAKSMSDVKKFNKEAGYNYFDRETMNFWGCKIESELYKNNTFVTSEDNFDRTKKLFTVRKYDPEDASIDTVGEFQAYTTVAAARAAAEAYTE